nr:MAG TPA: hypothetical protein [Caudoviricetes sp.]
MSLQISTNVKPFAFNFGNGVLFFVKLKCGGKVEKKGCDCVLRNNQCSSKAAGNFPCCRFQMGRAYPRKAGGTPSCTHGGAAQIFHR